MVKVLEHSIDPIEKNKDNYSHWLEDPVILHWLRIIFDPVMKVKGVLAHIQPWKKPVPTPTLRIEDGYLRLMMRGSTWSWRMLPIEDLRELSNHQWHEPTELEEDWLITLFGVESDKKKEEADELQAAIESNPGGAASSSSAQPSSQPRPAPVESLEEPLVPPYENNEENEEKDDQGDPGEQAQQQEEDDGEAAAPAAPREEVLKPTYDFRRVYKKLPALATADEKAAKRLLLGLHERMWHCPIMDFRSILIRCGMPPEVLRLAAEAVSSCAICRKFVRATRRPQVKTNLATNFNETIQVDIFYFKGDSFLLIVDEATRYKGGGILASRELSAILKNLINNWLKFFGPPRELIADQESSLMT